MIARGNIYCSSSVEILEKENTAVIDVSAAEECHYAVVKDNFIKYVLLFQN